MPIKEHYQRYKDYYQAYQRNRYLDPKHHKKCLQYQRNYRKTHKREKEYTRKISKNYRDRQRSEWPRNFSPENTLSAEELVADQILPSLGFTNIIWLTDRGFPRALWGDILASKDGSKYSIEVTTGIVQYFYKKTFWEILKFLDLELLVCFIRPNLVDYFLHKVPKHGLTGIVYSNRKYLISSGQISVGGRYKNLLT